MSADLRLFGAAAGVWAGCLAALWVPPLAAAIGGGLAAAVGIAAMVVMARSGRRGGRGGGGAYGGQPGAERAGSRVERRRELRRQHLQAVRWALVAVLLGGVCGAWATSARTWVIGAEPLVSLVRAGAVVRVDAVVADDPVLLRSGFGPPSYLVPVDVTQVDQHLRVSVSGIVFGRGDGWRTLLPSQRVTVSGRLAPPQRADLTAFALQASGPPQLVGAPSWLQRAAGGLRAGLQRACAGLPDDVGGLLPGLVIGDTSRLDPGLADDFRATGLTHITAVSGANLAVILAVVLFLARWCRAGPWLSAGICTFALIGFVILARPSPSVVRAAIMGGVGLIALATGRSRAAAPALAATVVVALLVNPALAVDAGFTLSVLATGALVLVAPRWGAKLRARGVPGVLAEALAAAVAAQLACGPVIAALSGAVSLVAVPANVLAAMAVTPATLLGVAAAVVSPAWPSAASGLAWLASWPARWLVVVARTGARVPDGTLPWPGGLWGGIALAAVTAAVALALRRPVARRLALVAAVAVAVGAVPVRVIASGWPPRDAVLVACDVGQGDGLVLPVASGEAVVVDTGPDPAPMDVCLGDLGVSRIALLVLTHFHADHVGGIAGALRGRRVDRVLVSDFDEPAAGYASVVAAIGSTPVSVAEPGMSFAVGDLALEVIGPRRRLSSTRSDPNNNSVVLRARRLGVSMLLPGDAEVEEQSDLVAAGVPLRADVLKVAHHGSPYQDPAFLAATHPAVAVVSVGVGNPYGHPNAAVLVGLTSAGARVVRTDQDGDSAVVAPGGVLGVVIRGRTHRTGVAAAPTGSMYLPCMAGWREPTAARAEGLLLRARRRVSPRWLGALVRAPRLS